MPKKWRQNLTKVQIGVTVVIYKKLSKYPSFSATFIKYSDPKIGSM